MDLGQVPAALHARLGDEPTAGLLQLLDRSQQEGKEGLINACTERFERRLVEEVSGLRVQIARDTTRLESTLRQKMAELGISLRQEMAGLEGRLRQEIGELRASVREEVAELRASLREDIAAGRVDLFKWCFLFWIGQVLAVSGIVGVMFRVMR
jgi:hypothetical protein